MNVGNEEPQSSVLIEVLDGVQMCPSFPTFFFSLQHKSDEFVGTREASFSYGWGGGYGGHDRNPQQKLTTVKCDNLGREEIFCCKDQKRVREKPLFFPLW